MFEIEPMGALKMQDWKMTDKSAGLENAARIDMPHPTPFRYRFTVHFF